MIRPLEGILIAGALALLFAVNAKTGPEGDYWNVRRGHDDRHAHIRIERHGLGHHVVNSFDIPWSRLKGLSAGQLYGSGNVKFELIGEAGSLLCEGKASVLSGASGSFVFRANPAFLEDLRQRGYAGELAPPDAFALTLHAVDRELVEALPAPGFSPTVDDLVKLSVHGIDATYLRAMRAAISPTLSAEDLVQARIHGVDAPYTAALRQAGYQLPMERVVQLKIHGVSKEYLAELHAQGVKPDGEALVEMRNHGVGVPLLKAMADSGYPVAQAHDAVRLATHGVGPDFVRDVYQMGYRVTPEDLVRMRTHGVDSGYLRKLAASGYQNLTPEKIVKLRTHGVD